LVPPLRLVAALTPEAVGDSAQQEGQERPVGRVGRTRSAAS
jgi:hypothetical protein